MKLLLVISLFVFTANTFDIPELGSNVASITCFSEYKEELNKIQSDFEDELKACLSSNNVECTENAQIKAEAAFLVVYNKIQECTQNGGPKILLDEVDSDVEDLSSKGSVRRECWRKHRGELKEIKRNLKSELRECKSNEDPKECAKTALAKAKAAALDVRNKIKKCIEDGSKPEPESEVLFEEISEDADEDFDENAEDVDGLSSKRSVRRECWRKHRGELREIRKSLRSELKECKSNEDPKECARAARAKAKAAALEVRDKIKKCIEDGSKPEPESEDLFEEITEDADEDFEDFDEADEVIDDLSSKGSVHMECLKKYQSELNEIIKNFLSESQACSASENRRECLKAALAKAKAAALEVRNKIKKCIEDGSKPEEPKAILEEIDSDVDDLSSKGSVCRECWRKHRGELREIRKNLKSELRQCRSNEDPKECAKAALTKAKAAALEVRNKIKKCIEDGSNKPE